jgi:NAD(P)-dependent dehydrogenase (short-subunit alcohol dehydrogenase family)
MVHFDFTDRVVVITGAAGALGSGVAQAFHQANAQVVLLDRSDNRWPALSNPNAPPPITIGNVNVMHEESVNAAIAQVMQQAGHIDALINTVGGYRAGVPLHEMPVEEADVLMGLNARSVFVTCRAAIPHMLAQGSGKIINIASRGALRGEAGASIYSASKSVVIRLTESMADELKAQGINVNCLLPGMIDTPANRAAMPDAAFSQWVTTAALADVIMFLCSDAAHAIHGASVPVYGRG